MSKIIQVRIKRVPSWGHSGMLGCVYSVKEYDNRNYVFVYDFEDCEHIISKSDCEVLFNVT